MPQEPPESLLRLRRALEAPLPPERLLPPGFTLRPYAPGDEGAWARLLHDNRDLGDWDEGRVGAMLAREEPAVLTEGTFFIVRDRELVATACTVLHRGEPPAEPVLSWSSLDSARDDPGLGERSKGGAPPIRDLLEIGWVGVARSARGHRLAYILSRHLLAYWQARAPRLVGEDRRPREVYILTDDWRVAAIVTYLRLGFRPEIAHPNHIERWRRLAMGFEGELKEWAMPERL